MSTPDQSTAERVTCPACGRTGRALTKAGRIKQHNDPTATALARRRGGPFDRELCTSHRMTPEQVASAVAE